MERTQNNLIRGNFCIYFAVVVIILVLGKDFACTCKPQEFDCTNWIHISSFLGSSFRHIVQAAFIGLLWVVFVFLEGNWFICCMNNHSQEQAQLPCKSEGVLTDDERAIIAELKNKSRIIGTFLLLGIVGVPALLSSLGWRKPSSGDRKNLYHQLILEQEEKVLKEILRQSARETLAAGMQNKIRDEQWEGCFDVAEELIKASTTPTVSERRRGAQDQWTENWNMCTEVATVMSENFEEIKRQRLKRRLHSSRLSMRQKMRSSTARPNQWGSLETLSILDRDSEHTQLACKDKHGIRFDEQEVLAALKNTSRVYGFSLLLSIICAAALMSLWGRKCCKDTQCNRRAVFDKLILKEEKNVLKEILGKAAKEKLTQEVNRRIRGQQWESCFDAAAYLIENPAPPIISETEENEERRSLLRVQETRPEESEDPEAGPSTHVRSEVRPEQEREAAALLNQHNGASAVNVSATSGEDLTVVCVLASAGQGFVFCKNKCKDEDILARTSSVRDTRGRFSIRYLEQRLYVSIGQLKESDSGLYTCGLDTDFSSASQRQFRLVVTDATPTSKPARTLQPLATTVPENPKPPTPPQSETPPGGILLCVGLTLAVVVVLSSLAVLIVCIKRKTKPRGLTSRRDDTRVEVPVYENPLPVFTCDEPIYQSLDPATRDQNQIYSTLTAKQQHK
ncbi:hypothetical protein Q8A73_014548 [Channa argus]|nr:hypothetical protein Q8A73_014548 [Channa argus]